jgi:hypothetical protein
MMFMKRSRHVSSLIYFSISMLFLSGAYLVDYDKYPRLKHSFWFLFNIFWGATIGAYAYQ